MRTGEVTATVAEPDGDGFVWMTICHQATCATMNLGQPGEIGVDVALGAAGLGAPRRPAIIEEHLATLH